MKLLYMLRKIHLLFIKIPSLIITYTHAPLEKSTCIELYDFTCLYYIYFFYPPTFSKRHKAAILGVAFPEPHLILTSSSDKHVRGFDLRDRDGSSPFRDRLYVRQPDVIGEHSKAVLCVAASGNYVYSGSEDRTVKLWDRRNLNEVLAKSKVREEGGRGERQRETEIERGRKRDRDRDRERQRERQRQREIDK